MIDERIVMVAGAVADKPSRQVHAAEAIEIAAGRPRFVSRGGDKLDAALDAFGIDVTGLRVIDIGASTGGFTDCVLQRGAACVVAVDVGRNQLHERLRADPRVVSMERTDVRSLDLAAIGGPAPLVVVDVSFISLRYLAAELRRLCTADIVTLVKPQFEAGKAEADRGRGVIRDPQVWRQSVLGVISSLTAAGTAIKGVMASPRLGASGNAEFLVHAHGGGDSDDVAFDAVSAVEDAVRAASALVRKDNPGHPRNADTSGSMTSAITTLARV